MGTPTVDPTAFVSRLEKLYTSWESEEEDNLWKEADVLSVVVGKDDVTYSKSTALQIWLFGYELADTLSVFCANEIHILSSRKKIEFLRPLDAVLSKRDDLPQLVLSVRNKADSDANNYKQVVDAMKKSKKGKVVGVFLKDETDFSGDFIEGWRSAMENSKMKQVDVSSVFAYASSVKDDTEVGIIKKACRITCTVFSKLVKQEIVSIVDEEKRVKHSKLAEEIEQAITDGKFLPPGTEDDMIEICYSPIIQSGGNYQLKFSTVSSDDRLHFGTILCCLGVRYKSYCSNIVRTMFVEPTQEMQDNYSFLLKVYDRVVEKLREGERLCDVYNVAVQLVETERPELKDHFTRNAGFVTGIEFREGSLTLSSKCTQTIKQGMVFNVNVGFSSLTNPSADDSAGKTYALFIGDTVVAGGEDGPGVELTSTSKKKISSIAIFMGEEEDNGQPLPEELDEVIRGKDRGARTDQVEEKIKHRKENQSNLTQQINQAAKLRITAMKENSLSKVPKLSTYSAYKHSSVVPRDADIQSHRVFVDRKYEAVVLPVHGTPTPFHISTVKNISKSEEGEYVYLRINFFHPGSSMGRVDGVVFPNPEATFIKEVSFRGSSSHGHGGGGVGLVQAFNLIKDVQKKFKTREQEKKELEGYVEQAALIMNSTKGCPRLKDLYMRPVIGSRRISGILEAHTNGVRYTTMKGDKVDILYSNIKCAFFQPSKKEMIVLLHFHLKHPIIIGKKKQKDIQFYTEVGEIMTDLGRAQHMHDRDDLLAESAERQLRAKLDNAFDAFRKKMEDLPQCRVHFEKPFKELGFFGVPHRSTVQLQPTTNCLVNLSEQPVFVLVLDEVELVHFERVQFHMRNFDMVFVFKDYKRKVSMVTAIPMSQLDSIKHWLDSCHIKYTEGVQSLNWAKIMKTINDDPDDFFLGGGWSFLDPESDNERGGSGDDSEDSDEYRPSDVSVGEESGNEEDSDEDYTSLSEDGSESAEEDSEEEDAMSWDELEEAAKREDRERERIQFDEGDSRKSSKSRGHVDTRRSGSSKHKSPQKSHRNSSRDQNSNSRKRPANDRHRGGSSSKKSRRS